MYDIKEIYEEQMKGIFPGLNELKVQFILRPEAGKSITHKYFGNEKYVILVHDSALIQGNKPISRGALALELASICLEEQVPKIFRGAYRTFNRMIDFCRKGNERRAEKLASTLSYSKDITDFLTWAHN
jgi:hypothetical protein